MGILGGAVVGLLFPGQGSQYVGMGRELVALRPGARAIFEEADEILGFRLSQLCFEGPETELTLTHNAQPAILTHSMAVFRVIESALGSVGAAAGHSLGEFSAWVAAGAISFTDAVATVRHRGELMLKSGEDRPGTMAAVIGLDDEAIEGVCRAASGPDGECVAANYNSPGQVVISGDTAAVERAMEAARAAGARRALPLNVSGAFHSPLMRVAEQDLARQLDAVTFSTPRFPVVSNVTAGPVVDVAEAKDLLRRQLTSPVRWADGIRTMRQTGCASFIEMGPGNVLTGLLRRIEREASGRAIDTAADVDTFLAG
jgi:[acyl-carrier-protein] S-malonyltransferase